MAIDGVIRERTRQRGITNDAFMGEVGSFQYSENLNVFDDARGIKLSTKTQKTTNTNKCILVSSGDFFIRIPKNGGTVEKVTTASRPTGTSLGTLPTGIIPYDAVIFNNYICIIVSKGSSIGGIYCIPVNEGGTEKIMLPTDFTDPEHIIIYGQQTPVQSLAICNFNNSMLVVGNEQYLWIYNPDEDKKPDQSSDLGRKIVKKYQAGTEILDISPNFNYIRIYLSDGNGNTKIHYYPGIFNLEDSGLQKSLELPNTEIMRVYPHMTKELITISLDNSQKNISLRKVIDYETYPLLRQRAGLHPLDTQQKLGYFLGPTSLTVERYDNRFYIADKEGVWEFMQTGELLEVGTLRRKMYEDSANNTPFGLAIANGYLFVSYEDAEYKMGIYDSGVDGYQQSGFLISRVFETEFGGEFTKELISWIIQYELNTLTTLNGKIEIFVCGNRKWNTPNDSNRIKIAEIGQKDINTTSKNFTHLGDFKFLEDWQTLEYMVKITLGGETHATPIFRSLMLNYGVKDKTNYF